MKASEVIEKLQEIIGKLQSLIKEHGDLEILDRVGPTTPIPIFIDADDGTITILRGI